MAADFPSSPTLNQTYTFGGRTWKWNGTGWALVANSISTLALSGATSGAVTLQAAAVAGSNTVTLPATTGTVVTTGDSGTVTNTMLANSTISGVALGGTLSTLTLGTGLSGTSYNGSGPVTASVSYGTTAGTACQGNDSRLSDTRNTTNALTFNSGGAGAASGSTFNGGSAVTVSYNTLGAAASNQTMFIGTTSVAINRASANLALTGISSVALPGATSGSVTLQPTATAGTTTITLPATTGTVVTTGDSGTVTSTMLASAVNSSLVKAWVNFSGAGTVAIRGNLNVSSVGDLGVGNYSINFTSSLTDTNYAVNITAMKTPTSANSMCGIYSSSTIDAVPNNMTTSSVTIGTGGSTAADHNTVSVAIFR